VVRLLRRVEQIAHHALDEPIVDSSAGFITLSDSPGRRCTPTIGRVVEAVTVGCAAWLNRGARMAGISISGITSMCRAAA